jgi:hypothetical protein
LHDKGAIKYWVFDACDLGLHKGSNKVHLRDIVVTITDDGKYTNNFVNSDTAQSEIKSGLPTIKINF